MFNSNFLRQNIEIRKKYSDLGSGQGFGLGKGLG
jgi:hypothetical protein